MEQRKLIYFDNNATTPVAREVVEAMVPFLTEHWGNPSSAYHLGNFVAKALEAAREKVAGLINATPREVIFTSCGTESINSAIQSALLVGQGKRHVVTTAVEHSASLRYCEFLRTQGIEVTVLPVEPDGSLDLYELDQAIRPDTALVSVMWANNETGVLFPIEEVAAISRSKGVLCHTDAVQAAGKVDIDVESLGIDFLSLSAHKLHAPKGIGMLYVRRRTSYQPLVRGGHQERGRRGGTENVPGIVAFGRAAELAQERMEDEQVRVRQLRDRLESGILQAVPNSFRNGGEPRLPNTANIGFDGIEAEAALMLLDQAGVCASSGSACTAGSLEPSHVLTAMGLPPDRARGSLRFSLSSYNSEEEVTYALQQIPAMIARLRQSSPVEAA